MRLWILVLAAVAALQGARPASGPVFDRVLPLAANEGVFAYARISPDGRLLAYASEMPDRRAAASSSPRRPSSICARKQTLFTEPGIDAYWSPDGERMIFLSQGGRGGVTIRHHRDWRARARRRAGAASATTSAGRSATAANLILTIQSNYYYLDGDKAVLPARPRRRRARASASAIGR